MDFDEDKDGKCPLPPFDCTFDEFRRDITQFTDVSLALEIEPSANVGPIQADCCGDPIVICGHDRCRNVCRITVTQRIRVRIPVTYTVITCVEDPIVNCCVDEPCCDGGPCCE